MSSFSQRVSSFIYFFNYKYSMSVSILRMSVLLFSNRGFLGFSIIFLISFLNCG